MKIIYILLFFLLSAIGAYSQSSEFNYLQIRKYQNDQGTKFLDEINYIDGLGRSVQTVQVGISPKSYSLYTSQEYDEQGREYIKRLPIIYSTNTGYLSQSYFENYAKSLYGSNEKAYSYTVYEKAPLNRVSEQYGPGQDWHANSRANKTEYITNGIGVLACIRFSVTGSGLNTSLVKNSNYAAKELLVTKLLDEDDNITYEFRDKLNRLVLSRRIIGTTEHDTYSVYDDMGNLSYVLPPMAVDAIVQNGVKTETIETLGYIYNYDDRKRCIMKKLPGIEKIYNVYDDNDNLILTQNGEMRKNGQWKFTIPDRFDRIVLTGICKNSISDIKTYLSNNVIVADRNSTTNSYKGYTISSALTLVSPVLLSINYYDDYSFMGFNGIPANTDANFKYNAESDYDTWYGIDYSDTNKYKNKGLLTGTLTAQMLSDRIDSANYLCSIMYYDNRNRLIQTKSNNHLFGGMEKEYIAYNFTDQPILKKHIHSITGKNTQIEVYTYTYDHAGRLLKKKHQLTDGSTVKPLVILAENTYDDFGRLLTHKKGELSNTLSTYSYNIRSWTKSISSPLFNQTLYYNDKVISHTYLDYQPLYSGNVSGMEWQLKDNNETTRSYRFCYDGLSRLTGAAYNGNIKDGMYNTAYTYDKHGNLTTLTRRGKNSVSADSNVIIDTLSMNYNGNQLIWVNDVAADVSYAQSADFKDKKTTLGTIEYTYNKNGAMFSDLNKGITEIHYNSLNLPSQMLINSSTVKAKNYYTYSAAGVKLKTEQRYDPNYSVVPSNATNPTNDGLTNYKNTDYVANIIYETEKNSTGVVSKTRILVDGGYIEDGIYYYYITDHLGNNRVVVNSGGIATQKNHYYPFGTAFAEKYDDGKKQPYKYNGKELDQMHGLNLYDYSARYYESAIGRFTSVDPLAEKYYSISPYVYCYNNPLKFIDPTGMDGELTGSGTENNPYVVSANYYYNSKDLNEDQINALNAALYEYNKKTWDYKESKVKKYVRFNLTAIDSNNPEKDAAADLIAYNSQDDYVSKGNAIGLRPSMNPDGTTKDELGSANGWRIDLNTDNIAKKVANGANLIDVLRSTFIHEIGHNLGLDHEYDTKIMRQSLQVEHTNQINPSTNNYVRQVLPAVDANGARFIITNGTKQRSGILGIIRRNGGL